MNSNFIRFLGVSCAAIAILTLSGCSGNSEPLTVDEQVKALEQDLGQMYAHQDALDHPLTLSEAMARGIKYNIDHRVTMMEQMVAQGEVNNRLLEMLPGLDLEAGYVGRDRDNVVSARNDATGIQSLPPSIFQDQHRDTAKLEMSWNVLDAGLAYVRSREASDKERAALERRRKVVQTITQDVRYAYWRAASAQVLETHIDDLLKRADEMNRKLGEEELKKSNKNTADLLDMQKRLYQTMDQLMAMRRELSTARADLAALINLPPNADIVIAAREGDMMGTNAVPALSTDIKDLEILALFIRPEMREQMLLKRMASHGVRSAVLESLPGIGAALGYNYDSNSFLKDEEWANFSLGLTQNLMKLFTLPVRLKTEENKEKLADMRRMAMAATVLTQMNVATIQYDNAKDRYSLLKRLLGVNHRIIEHTRAEKDKGLLHDGTILAAEMDHLMTRTALHLSYAQAQNAFGRIVSTIGLDPLPPGVEDKSLDDLTGLVEKRYDNLDENVIKALLETVRAQTNLLNKPETVAPAAATAAEPAKAAENPA